jgi:hypothetical protein
MVGVSVVIIAVAIAVMIRLDRDLRRRIQRPVRVGKSAVSDATSRSRRQNCRVFAVALVDNQASVAGTRIMPTFRGCIAS